MSPEQSPANPASTTPVVVVHVTDRPEGLAALDRALTTVAERTRSTRLHVVLSGSDHQGSSAYFSPAVRAAVLATLADSGVDHAVSEAEDDPVQTVLDVLEETSAELLVTGVRRRSRTMKFLLGSHTQQLILDAECPVLAVKGPREVD